ncbi:MAG TPA: hypothetical protein PKG96_07250 [Bacilli bacterium]|jgi:hypothetical protein|nr:hypothetical protein [Bacilli bacterium]HQM07251.1 hypothetical protein [Bacilli bacterium]
MIIEKLLNEILRILVTLLILLMILYALVPSANAETTYYILGDRNVVRTYTPDPVGEDKIVYVDCKKLRSQDDVLGCIIAANYAKEKQLEKVASNKKRTPERVLAKH